MGPGVYSSTRHAALLYCGIVLKKPTVDHFLIAVLLQRERWLQLPVVNKFCAGEQPTCSFRKVCVSVNLCVRDHFSAALAPPELYCALSHR